jgi:hypothetical protein
MPETYQTWDINSVGDAPDNGTTPGCGTKEVANIKHIIDKVGPPNAVRLAEISSLVNGRIVIVHDAANYHVQGSPTLNAVDGGLSISKPGDCYLTFGDGDTEKLRVCRENGTNDLVVSSTGNSAEVTFRMKQSNGDIGVGDAALPAGVLHVLKTVTGAIQRGINKNVGPLATGFTRDSVTGMVNLADSGVITNGSALNFLFAGNYQGMLGHGDIHAYLPGDGNSFYCHFSVRFATETTVAITLDFGDISGEGQKFFISDAWTGIRLLISASAGPNYNPVLIVKNSFGQSVDVSYDFHLRKCIFS